MSLGASSVTAKIDMKGVNSQARMWHKSPKLLRDKHPGIEQVFSSLEQERSFSVACVPIERVLNGLCLEPYRVCKDGTLGVGDV